MLNKLLDKHQNNFEILSNIYEIFNEIKYDFKIISKETNNFILKNHLQNGGVYYEEDYKNNKYFYNVETAIPTDIQNAKQSLKLIT